MYSASTKEKAMMSFLSDIQLRVSPQQLTLHSLL